MKLLVLAFFGLVATARAEWTLAFRQEIAALPKGAELTEREARRGDEAVRIQGVFFSEKSARLAVIDNPSRRRSLAGEMVRAGALAGTNGGYFQDNGAPVGLVIADGAKIHSFQRAKLLSGVLVASKKHARLVRSSAYEPAKGDVEALQAGPFLVDGGRPVAGLNAERAARRTVVATDGSGRWALLLFSHVTLADTASILSSHRIFPDFRIVRALNLDGGSSSGLWAAVSPKPFYVREIWSVRNFLAVLPR